MFEDSERERRIRQAFENPKVGTRFTEMYSFWVHVVHVGEDLVAVEEYVAPCEVPKDAKLRYLTREKFRTAYAYEGSTDGWWVSYIDESAPYEHHENREDHVQRLLEKSEGQLTGGALRKILCGVEGDA